MKHSPVIAGLPLLGCLAAAAAFAQSIHQAPASAPSRGILAPASEPGPRLVVSGEVVDESGAPVAGASLYVYQTDAEGYYGVKPASDSNNPRLELFLRSGPKGEWSFETIRPGSYPGSRNPGHIHFEVAATGYRDHMSPTRCGTTRPSPSARCARPCRDR
jgi:protocatechuate 3,4-dioxygenase beta subunit